MYNAAHNIGVIFYRGDITFQCYLDMQQTVTLVALSWSLSENCQPLDNARSVAIWELHFREEDSLENDNAIQLLFIPKDGISSNISTHQVSLALSEMILS